VSTPEAQKVQTRQSLQAAQAAVSEQAQLLERQRAIIGQNAELQQIDRLEEDISRTQEVCSQGQQVDLLT